MKKWLTFGIPLCIALLGLHYYWKQYSQTQAVAEDNEELKPAEAALQPYANQARLVGNQILSAPGANPTTPECLQFLSEIQRLDLNTLNSLSEARLPSAQNCSAKPALLVALVDDYQRECVATANTASPKEQHAKCLSALHFLRAGISFWQTSDQSIDAISDLNILTDRMSLALKQAVSDASKAKELGLVAERILELDPKLYAAAKAALLAALFATKDTSTAKNSDYWSALEKLAERAHTLNTSDSQLPDIELMIRTHGFDPEQCVRVAEAIIAKNPALAGAWELMAYGQWKLNNRDRSLEAMRRAMALNPNDSFLQKNWARINESDANINSFLRNPHSQLPFVY